MSIQIRTTVLPGNRIEITAAELPVGKDVTVIIEDGALKARATTEELLDYIASLPPSGRSREEWEKYDQQFQSERDSWDR